MTTLKEAAKSYVKKKAGNIADLEQFDISEEMEEKTGTDSDGKDYSYSVLLRDGEEYRVPNSVLKTIKGILEANEKHGKEVNTFSVEKSGSGLDTQYQVVQIE